MLTFKPGAFIPGVPVQPIMISYPNTHDTVSWTWDQEHGAVACILLTMLQTSVSAEIHFLPRYVPSQEEREDAQVFADNVRRRMAEHAGVALCDMTYAQLKEKYSSSKKKQT